MQDMYDTLNSRGFKCQCLMAVYIQINSGGKVIQDQSAAVHSNNDNHKFFFTR